MSFNVALFVDIYSLIANQPQESTVYIFDEKYSKVQFSLNFCISSFTFVFLVSFEFAELAIAE